MSSSQRSNLWLAIVLPLTLFSAAFGGVGWYAYTAGKQMIVQDIASDMEAIARLKSGQIEEWLAERRDDAQWISTRRLSFDLREWLKHGGRDKHLASRIMEQLQFPGTAHYRNVSLYSAVDGRLLLSSGIARDSPTLREKVLEVAKLGQPLLEDMRSSEGEEASGIRVGYFAPLLDVAGDRPLAVIHLGMDPREKLFPLLQAWPGASKSAETLLLRREGDQVIYLNALRHVGDSALRLRRALATPNFVAARMIVEGRGFFDANDYRGVPALAYGIQVAGTPWLLVAKIDREEALAQLNVIAIYSSLLLAALLLIFSWWLIERRRTETDLSCSLSELRTVEQELIGSREQLRKLAIFDNGVREAERKRIAREVHDELGQLLTALRMDIVMLQMRFDGVPGLFDKTEEMLGLIENTIKVVRHVTSNLRPPALDSGIVGALDWLAEDFTRRTSIPCLFDRHNPDLTLEDTLATTLFRIVQESLTNVTRHAQASHAAITLTVISGRLRLTVEDNGCGFDPRTVMQARNSFGLLGMHERAAALKGKIIIDSSPGRGSRVLIELPLLEGELP